MVNETHLFATLQHIFHNLGFEVELPALQDLLQEFIYLEICSIIFPDHRNFLERLADQDISPAQKIQQIINLLAQEIENADLSQFSGQAIAKGDLIHLHKFLRFLQQVSLCYREEIMDQEQIPQANSVPTIKPQKQFNSDQVKAKAIPKIADVKSPAQPLQNESREFQDRILRQEQQQQWDLPGGLYEKRQISKKKQKAQSKRAKRQSQRPRTGKKKESESNKVLQRNQDRCNLYLKEYLKNQKISKSKRDSIRKSLKGNQFRDRKQQRNIDQIKAKELSLHLKLRDQQERFISKINRLVFNLEKEKIKDQHSQLKNFKRKLATETMQRLTNHENTHFQKFSLLKEKLMEFRLLRRQQEQSQREMLRAAQRHNKSQQDQKLRKIEVEYAVERQRVQMMYTDNNLQQKLVSMYKKL